MVRNSYLLELPDAVLFLFFYFIDAELLEKNSSSSYQRISNSCELLSAVVALDRKVGVPAERPLFSGVRPVVHGGAVGAVVAPFYAVAARPFQPPND